MHASLLNCILLRRCISTIAIMAMHAAHAFTVYVYGQTEPRIDNCRRAMHGFFPKFFRNGYNISIAVVRREYLTAVEKVDTCTTTSK
jgi:predicted SnoaL-like aldol condensation-catalyzing enzyme